MRSVFPSLPEGRDYSAIMERDDKIMRDAWRMVGWRGPFIRAANDMRSMLSHVVSRRPASPLALKTCFDHHRNSGADDTMSMVNMPPLRILDK